MSHPNIKPADSRPPSPRIEQERVRRRRRDDMGDGRLRNLAIAGTLDDRYTYRWVNDDPGRIYKLNTLDDWDPVTTDELGERHDKDKGVGSNVERVVDRTTGRKAVLMRKLKEFYTADKAKEQTSIDGIDAALRTGQVRAPAGISSESVEMNKMYVPAGGISISDGRKG